MRKTLFALSLFLLWSSWAAGQQYHLEVDGLACPFCAYGIEKKLSQLQGVERVETDIAKGRIIVDMADDQMLSKQQVQQAVQEAGFTLRAFKPAPQGAE